MRMCPFHRKETALGAASHALWTPFPAPNITECPKDKQTCYLVLNGIAAALLPATFKQNQNFELAQASSQILIWEFILKMTNYLKGDPR